MMTKEKVAEDPMPADVSRETLNRLKIYSDLVVKWNPSINLVSKQSVDQIWTRHILDSIQIFSLVKSCSHWLDIGSGGGFPGLIIGMLAAEKWPDMQLTLIESDKRKCTFLRTVARETGLKVAVLPERIEHVEAMNADVVSARALADLTRLLSYTKSHLSSDGIALFPKGVTWQDEVSKAQKDWRFDYEVIKSKTQEGAVILKVWGATHV